MKKLYFLAAILAMGTMCVTACNMSGDTATGKPAPETRSIVVQDESEGEQTPTPCPDDNCNDDGNCSRDKMPFAKPNFRFHVPHGKHEGHGRDRFGHRHKKPAPAPEPENPETPAEN